MDMQASSFKLQPPTFDSKKESWGKFLTDSCSYVIIQGGQALVDKLLGNSTLDSSIIHNPTSSPNSRNNVVADQEEDEETLYTSPDQDSSRGLSQADHMMNSKFYHVLKLCLKGPAHDAILHVNQATWTEAMLLLQKEYGNSTALRKSKLIVNLFDLQFEGDIDKFKQKTLTTIREIYESKVTFEDFIVSMILQAFQGEEYTGIRLDVARQLDTTESINVHEMLDIICNAVETTKSIKKTSTNNTRSVPKGPCTRCGGNHARNDCYATKHKDGHKLKDRAPAKRPQPRGKGGGGKGNKGKDKKEEKNKNGDDTPKPLSEVLSGMRGGSMSLDQVKNAVAKCTSLHVTTKALTTNSNNVVAESGNCHNLPQEGLLEPQNGITDQLLDEVIDAISTRANNLAQQAPTPLSTNSNNLVAECNDDSELTKAQLQPQNGITDQLLDEVIDAITTRAKSTASPPPHGDECEAKCEHFDPFEPSHSNWLMGVLHQDGSEAYTEAARELSKARVDALKHEDPSILEGKFLELINNPKNNQPVARNNTVAEPRIEGYDPDQLFEEITACMASDQPKTLYERSLPPTHTKAKVAWVLDSGSGQSLASKVQNIDTSQLCIVEGYDGNNQQVSAGMGHVPMFLGGSDSPSSHIDLDGVYQMEGLPQDILSLGRLVQEKGFSFHADDKRQFLTTPQGHRIPVYIEEGIFYVDGQSSQSSNNVVADSNSIVAEGQSHYIRSNQQKVDVLDLHARLGHISGQALKDTLNNTYGIRCTNADLDFFCPTCAIGKSIKQPVGQSRDPETKPTRVGELIYTDIKDLKLTTPGRNGFVKYIIYVDAYSNWVSIHGLKRKNEAQHTIEDLDVELGLSKKPYQVTFRFDNDPASYGSDFQQALKHRQFAYDPLPPYTPARNMAERAIQAIDVKARTMLIDAPHVDFEPHYFDASLCATYLNNRTVGTRGKTPFEFVKGAQPMIKHLVPFGCFGYMHAEAHKIGNKIPNHHRAEQVIMLGYRSPFSNIWKVQAQDDQRRVLHSIHVDWDFEGHGLSNTLSAMSKDHLDALGEQWGIDLTIEHTNKTIEGPQQASCEPSPTAPEAMNTPTSDLHNSLEAPKPDYFGNNPQCVIEPLPNIQMEPSNNAVAETELSNNTVAEAQFSPTHAEIVESHIVDHSRIHHNNVVHKYAKIHKTKVEVALKEALQGHNSKEWKNAILKEINSMLEHCLFLIDEGHPEYETAIKEATWSRFVLVRKRDGRFKARWVVQGCFESVELDDFTNRSHVASIEALRALLFKHDRGSKTLATIDIRTAFLQSHDYDPHEKHRYVKVINPFDPTKVLYARLLSPMYGQRSAPRRWEDTLAPWLESQGFIRGKNEPSIFYRPSDEMIILVYVDDLLMDGDIDSIHQFLKALLKRFDCNDPVFLAQDQPIDFIGIDIFIHQDCIFASSQQYCCRLLDNLQMANVNPASVPITGDIVEDDLVTDKGLHEWYRSGVGGIGWLVSTTRPDLALTFSRLGQFLAQPTQGAIKALRQACKYIKGTTHYALSMPLNLTSNTFEHWSDSDFASNKVVANKRKSQTGIIGTINGVPHVYKSTAQSCVTLSSTEAEIHAASTAISHFEHSKFVLQEMGIKDFPTPFTLQIDNAAAEVFMENTKSNSRLKHIDVREKWVLEMRDRSKVIPEHVSTHDNLADLFTKPLAAPTFEKHVERIMWTTPFK